MSKKKIDELLDLARMQIELGDIGLTSKNATASLFALCYLTNQNPRDVAEGLFTNLPDAEEWEEEILPHILNFPEGYEPLTGG